jgi:hypothetical protein
MAPEQARGETVDARCDLFSLGCVLYRLCAGVQAFKGADSISTLMAVATENPRPPRQVSADVPEALSALVMRLLAKKPEGRPASARAVAEALEAIEHTAPPTTRRQAGKTERLPAPTTTGPVQRGRMPLILAACVLLIGLAVGGYFLVAALLSQEAPDATPVAAAPPAKDPDKLLAALGGSDFRPLLNGKDLAGWVGTDGLPARWKVQDGYIEVAPAKGNIMTRENFGPDFQLQAEFWLPLMANRKGQARANSGIFLQGRHEIQILDSFDNPDAPTRGCGALYGLIAPGPGAIRPPEQWQTFDITFHAPRVDARGQVITRGRVTVIHNGIKVIDDGEFAVASGGALDLRLGTPGPIMLQDHGAAVRFRNLKIKELKPELAAPGWVPLFNGKDLTGWKVPRSQPLTWRAEDGLLTGRSDQGTTHLFSERGDFGNFHMRAEVKVNDNGNSGIFFRSPFGLPLGGIYPGGYEAQIMHRGRPQDPYLTGSLHGLVKAPPPALAPDEWFTMEVIAVDHDLTVKVNGQLTAHYLDDQKGAVRGHFALQAMEPKTTVVQFRKIEVKELPASKGPDRVSLFNGHDLTGWEIVGKGGKVAKGGWTGGGGTLKAVGFGGVWLATTRTFADFELELEYRLVPKSHSGIFLRASKGAKLGDFARIVLADDAAMIGVPLTQHTGALFRRAGPDAVPQTPTSQWHKVRIRALGPQLKVWINDEPVLDTHLPAAEQPGVIGLQHYLGVEFRNLWIRELSP